MKMVNRTFTMLSILIESSSEISSRPWCCCNKEIPSSEIVFFTQIIVVYLVIITCIANLTLGNNPHDLWISLLASSLGYILPSPTMRGRDLIFKK